ncbi:MAG: protease-like activity factor CPAF [Bdellovibrionota bacterium]
MVTALLALSLAPFAHAGTLVDDVSNSLEAMRAVYSAEYAPADWKKHYIGYDLNTELDKELAALHAKPDLTQADAREILKNFVYAMHDYHVSISFLSTEAATLPLTIRSGGGRYFIAAIDRSKLGEKAFPFHLGDEVLTFDNKPVALAAAEVASQFTANIAGTDAALSELRLTSRSASRGLRVPQGPVSLGIVRKGEGVARGVQLIWDYTPELINPRAPLGALLASAAAPRASAFHPMMSAAYEGLTSEDNPQGLGTKVTFTPDLGEKVWEAAADNTFHAYIFKDAKGERVGYVRLAGYHEPDYVKAVADFATLMKIFQAGTEKLVIDQVNNPGGSVFYVYTLASMLTDQPLLNPRHRMSVTQRDVSDALDVIKQLKDVKNEDDALKALKPDDLDGYPGSYEVARFMLNNAHFLISEFNAGRKLTAPYFIGGVDHVNPAATAYTKPILLLVNHLDFSGGDFFPSILQDNKRATILGSRTSGAGGYVVDVKIPNNVGIDTFRVTESIAERADGNPIENLGVTPDIVHEMTANDMANDYVDYVNAIQDALGKL